MIVDSIGFLCFFQLPIFYHDHNNESKSHQNRKPLGINNHNKKGPCVLHSNVDFCLQCHSETIWI